MLTVPSALKAVLVLETKTRFVAASTRPVRGLDEDGSHEVQKDNSTTLALSGGGHCLGNGPLERLRYMDAPR